MSAGDEYGRSAPEAPVAAPEITRSDIQNAVDVICKALLDPDSRHRIDNPISIKFDRDVKIFKEDGFVETGAADVARAIADTIGIKPNEPIREIQNAVDVISKALLADVEKRMDSPIELEFGNGVKLLKNDIFVNAGGPNVGAAIADIAGIKPAAPALTAPRTAAPADAAAEATGNKFTFAPNELGRAMYPQLRQHAEFHGDDYNRVLDTAMGEKAKDIPAGEFFVGGKNADTVSVALTSKAYPEAGPQIVEIGPIKRNTGPKV